MKLLLLVAFIAAFSICGDAQTHTIPTLDRENTWTAAQTGPFIDSGANVIDVRSKGALCDGTTNDYTAISAAITAAIAVAGTVKIPDGKTCAYGTTLSITSGNFAIVGGSGAKLKYTGSATDAILIDGTGLTNGARMVLLRDFAIDAPLATNALHTKKMANSIVSNIEVRGVSGIGHLHEFAVADYFLHPVVSVNNAAFSHQPVNGFVLQNIASSPSQDNVIENPVIEGMSGDGIQITNSNVTTLVGGTSEANSGRGVYVLGNSYNTSIIGIDVEANTGNDIELASAGNISTILTNVVSAGTVTVTSSSVNTQFYGGKYNVITLTANGGSGTPVKLDGFVTYNTLNDTDVRHNPIFNTNVTLSAGGAFSGAGFGSGTQNLYSTYWTSVNANPAAGGVLRLATADQLRWRNNANSGDIALGKNTSDQITGAGIPFALAVASGTSTFTTTAVGAGACQTTVTTAATNALTSDTIVWAYASAPTAATDGVLHILPYVTANNVNFMRCNASAGSITPTALVINWRVIR